ncbi:MAG: hypothetical protein F4X64_10605 [Chloroflexi bacterium]|nr:hypothetical protein [Chloroflexota bacterium]
MPERTVSTLQNILEECRDGDDGIGFNEVVVMLESTAASAEVYMDFDDLRFTPDGRIVTLMVPGGTHMHLDMSKIREAEFVHTTNDQGLPSYQLWMRDGEGNPAMRIYLRKSDVDAANPPRHEFFMGLLGKYPDKIALSADEFDAAGEHP